MGFEPDLQQSLDQSLRAHACALLEQAAAGLQGEREQDEAVHEARKGIKKLRALLRLIELPLGRKFRPCDRYFRDIARSLSPLRDAVVQRQVLELLGRQHPELAELTGRLQPLLPVAKVKKPGKLLRQAATALLDGRQRVARWPPFEPRFRTLGAGFRTVYQQAREPAWLLLGREPAEPWHQWRKWVKYHGYQLRLLQPLAPDWLQPRALRLKALGERLGDEHDLDMLAGILLRHDAALAGATGPALALIGERRDQLRRQALQEGQALFADEPGEMSRRLKQHWRRD
ncbi:CHAD domain-containing protein [Zobellella sp. DQSA1]|uniref:CHAD domain-containing protein n=1 Tax=Zobellella sp. DQSA1 TaxID=3342386 RepID=UPI0035C068B7